jgi:hypothetical protein
MRFWRRFSKKKSFNRRVRRDFSQRTAKKSFIKIYSTALLFLKINEKFRAKARIEQYDTNPGLKSGVS